LRWSRSCSAQPVSPAGPKMKSKSPALTAAA
jgi:hypothetical protein